MEYDSLGRLRFVGSFKSLIVAILVVVLGGMFVYFSCVSLSNWTGRSHDLAQKEADKFLRNSGLQPNAQCVGMDTDGDNYLSCPYVTPDGQIHPLECAGGGTRNTGCRIPKWAQPVPGAR